MNKKNPRVSIIILNNNSLAMTKEQLEDVGSLNVGNMNIECVVVDNGSTDGTESAIKNYKLPNMAYKFLQSGQNLGFAGGNNIGIEYAIKNKADYIILMNNDLILSKDVVVQMVNYMQQNNDVGLASPKIYFASGFEFHKSRYKNEEKGRVIWYAGGVIDRNNVYTSHRGVDEVDAGQYDEIIETDSASGACMIIRPDVVKKIGLLDDSLFLYWEDADYSERAKRAGFKVIYFPKTHIWHKVSVSTGGSGGEANDYFLTRNRYYYSIKYSTIRTKIAVIKDTIRLAIFGRPWQRYGAIDALIGVKGMGKWAAR